jgi:FtsP/CotA-like multicopper oxidase with cupredoxin domain
MSRASTWLPACLALFTLSACTGTPGSPITGQPAGWDQGVRLAEAEDLDPSPGIVEVNLEARIQPLPLREGTTTPVWTYNGRLPGPLIRARVGDRLIVNFTNNLPRETTIHWHGLRVPVHMDGVPRHSGPAVEPGATFRYDFVLPDAGLFWYHPHFESASQVADGLYGTLLVDDPDEPEGLGDEVVLQLSDIGVDDQGQLLDHRAGGDIATLFGREGNLILVNGRSRPTLLARAGRPLRWRIVNSASARYFQLALAGHRFVRIGGDGGLISEPQEVEDLLVIPGERADVVVVPRGAPGEEIPLRWVAYDRGYGTAFRRPDEEVMRLRISSDPPEQTPALPVLRRRIEPLATAGATPVRIDFTRNDVGGRFALGINGKPAGMDEPFHGQTGETQIWTIGNRIDWAHPFHMHGFFFQLLEDDGSPRLPLEWKDTVNVPVKGTVKMVIRYDDRPGMWMFHCHILDHADAGMMGMLELTRPGDSHPGHE